MDDEFFKKRPSPRPPADSSRGMLRSKIECGMGTVPLSPKIHLQTWDGVMSGDRLLTMACSDKILRWNVVGMSVLKEPSDVLQIILVITIFFLFKSVIFFTNSTVSSSKLKIELFCVKICKFQFYTAFALCRPREYSLRIWQWCINVCSMNWIMNVQIFKFCSTTSVESLGGWWCSTICIIYYKLFKMKSLNILTLQDHTTSGRCRKALWLWASWDFSDVGYGLWCHILIY